MLVAFLLFTLLRNIAGAFDLGVDLAGVDRLMVSPKYSIIDPLPIRHMDEIAAVAGVEAVTHADWFGGFYQEPSNFFPKFPVRPKMYFDLYPEYVIDPAQLEAFDRTRTGAVVPAAMAVKFGWKVGDRIPIEADIWPKKDGSRLWEFDLVGTYTGAVNEPQPSQFLFHYDYFDEARQFASGSVGWFIVRVQDPDDAPVVSSAIDALFENSMNPTRTATEAEFQRQFANQIGDIGLIVTGILGAVFFTILLLTANTMAQALRERIPELAVLKTFGFTDASVSLLVLGESVLLCLVGGVLGVLLGAAVSYALKPSIEQILGLFEVSWSTALVAVGLAAVLGLVVGAVPAAAARRLAIVDALRAR